MVPKPQVEISLLYIAKSGALDLFDNDYITTNFIKIP